MPLRIIDGADALDNFRTNTQKNWPRKGAAGSRLEPLCRPGFVTDFRINRSDKIYTIGSCFARNIEAALDSRGFDVVTRRIQSADPEFSNVGTQILNNYGVASILNELEWGLLPEKPYDPDMHIFETSPGQFLDIHLNAKAATRETVLARRAAIQNLVRQIVDCRIVVITLGLSEAWYDTLSGYYVNYTVHRSLIKKYPGRFQMRVLSYEETIDFLRRSIKLLTDRSNVDLRVLLTVSPVPLTATYTDGDIITANCYSKAVLRAAAEQVVLENDHVTYYPSYESITLSDRNLTWEDDQIHVRKPLIDLNVSRMVAAYADVDQAEGSQVDEVLRNALSATNGRVRLKLLETIKDHAATRRDVAIAYVETCVALDLFADGLSVVDSLNEDEREPWREKLSALQALKDGRADEAMPGLQKVAEREPRSALIWKKLSEAALAVEQGDVALDAAARWARLIPNSGEAMRRIAQIHVSRGHFDQADNAFRSTVRLSSDVGRYGLDYVEFLMDRGRLEDAARLIAKVIPENTHQLERAERLKAMLPEVDLTQEATSTALVSEKTVEEARAARQVQLEAKETLRRATQLFQLRDFRGASHLVAPLIDTDMRAAALPLYGKALVRMRLPTLSDSTLREVEAVMNIVLRPDPGVLMPEIEAEVAAPPAPERTPKFGWLGRMSRAILAR